jgi:hypothetical protein
MPSIALADSASELVPGVEYCDPQVRADSRLRWQGAHCLQPQSWRDSFWRFVRSAFELSSAVCAAREARRFPLGAVALGLRPDRCN